MKMWGILAIILIIMGFGLQSVSAASSAPSLNNITTTTQEALNNASDAVNQTAKDVQNTLNPLQDILNTINSVLNTITSIVQNIQQIFNSGY